MANSQNSTIDRETTNGSALWRIVVAEYEREKAAFAKAEADLDAASAALREAVPAWDDKFATYSLARFGDIRLPRTTLVQKTEVAVAMVDYKGRSDLGADDFEAIARKAAALVDEYLAFRKAEHEAEERAYSGGVQERFDAACDKLGDARERLIETPAPDSEALLHKLAILTEYLADCDSEDKERVQAIEADCKRILRGA